MAVTAIRFASLAFVLTISIFDDTMKLGYRYSIFSDLPFPKTAEQGKCVSPAWEGVAENWRRRRVPREKFQTLTEQMFYILLCLREERCGADIMNEVSAVTEGRVVVGPGTLYNLLEQFLHDGMIEETGARGRRRSYRLTDRGRLLLCEEYDRLRARISDYDRLVGREEQS